ncbi:putative Rep [Circoviridae TaCV2]|uniref:Replication-associated protein n=1 Tax=Circoviridae TaCV2 TaxID=2094725 RepID=A0A2L2P5L6_9VIRU|nr:putative Rep [Circoviridae TaCV2]
MDESEDSDQETTLKKQKKLRAAVFTLNNYTEEEYESLKLLECKYIIIAKEVGMKGTPHLQGYVEFQKQVRYSNLFKINKRIHWEERRGTQQQAIDYCKKEGNYIEIGEKKKQGERIDLQRTYQILDETGSMQEIMKKRPSLQMIKTAEKWVTWMDKERNEKPIVTWIFGESGSGKSKLAQEMSQGKNTYWKDDTKWWNGYDQEEVCIIDDFRSRDMTFTQLLRLLDRYPYRVEFKGGSRQFNSKTIIITSIKDPLRVYNYIEEDEPYEQLKRRIDKIIFCKKNQEPKELTQEEINEIENPYYNRKGITEENKKYFKENFVL